MSRFIKKVVVLATALCLAVVFIVPAGYAEELKADEPVMPVKINEQVGPDEPAEINEQEPAAEEKEYETGIELSSMGRYQRYSISNTTDYMYAKPGMFDFLTNIPGDYKKFYNRAFRKENLPIITLITASTIAMIVFDKELIEGAEDIGESLGIQSTDNTKPMITSGKYDLFRGPTDFGSSLYFIGDGWVHFGTAASFLGYGMLKDDNRALQTASQLFQGMISVTIVTQTLKHVTGRESPFVATEDTGRWQPLPDQKEYHDNIPRYDAFPSGHVAVATMTVTVIAENYPEYTFVRPVGYTLIGLLSFQMMNNGVHWASDYPLSIGIGYLFGKIAVENGRRVEERKARGETNKTYLTSIGPRFTPDGAVLLNLRYDLPY